MLPWPCILPGIRVSKIPGVVQGLSAVATGVRLLPLSITLLQAAVGVPKIFLTGIQDNPDVPKDVAAQAQVELTGGIPFLSDKDLRAQLDKAGVPAKTADAIVEENANARIAGLRSSLSLLAIIALIALFAIRRIPAQQPSASPGPGVHPRLVS